MFIFVITRSCSNFGRLRSKTRSLGQIEKPCKHTRGHIFASIFMMFGQNVYLDDIKVKFEFGLCGVKN